MVFGSTKKKPDMTVFLDKFVNLINKVTDTGIPCIIDDVNRLLNLYVLTCCCDAPARCQVCGMAQYNAEYGCPWCLHKGEYHGSMRSPFLQVLPTQRTHDDIVSIMMEIIPDGNPIFGIKFPSPLIKLKSYNFKKILITDYLHIFEGLGEMFASYHIDSLSECDIKKIDEVMMKISATQQISRYTTPMSNRKNWKAREWENYILYYSVPILLPILSPTQFNHWLLFVESFYILLQDRIHIDELNTCNQMLHDFVAQTEELYDITAMTFNLHQLLHICENVLNWGPLWTNSTFCFESANYYLLRAIKSANGVTQQVIRFVNLNHKERILEKKLIPTARNAVVKYCNDILASRVENEFCSDGIMYFNSTYISECLDNVVLDADSQVFLKCVKDHCLYESTFIKKTRSNNTIVQLNDGSFLRIICFIVNIEGEQDQTIGNIVNTSECFNSSYSAFRIVDNINAEITFVSTNSINRNCVFMDLEYKYICPVPNKLHY